MRIPPFRVGQEIDAARVEELRKLAEALSNIRAVPPLEVSVTSAGIVFRLVQGVEFWAKITAGSNPYTWKEQVPTGSGGWQDGARSGTLTLTEANGNSTIVANTIVRVYSNGDGSYSFVYGTC